MLPIKQETYYQNDQIHEEPPLDALVHSKEMLKKVIFPFPEIRHLRKSVTMSQFLVGCLAACKTVTESVIVGEVASINPTSIMFKHSTTYHSFDHLEYVHITDEVFRLWIDQLVMRDEPLPLYALYLGRKLNLLKRWNKQRDIGNLEKKGQEVNDAGTELSKELEKRFGADTQWIMATPLQLVQLLQLGRKEFERVVVGLYVCCVFTMRSGEERYFIELIRKVSWGAVPYQMYGQTLTTLLHFENANAGPCPVFAVQFPSPETDQALINNQHSVCEFIAPSTRHIERKSRQLQEAIIKTMNGSNSLMMNETYKNFSNST